MTAYAEVLDWSQALPAWQRDALRRLATHASLTDADLEQIVAACMAEANGQPAPPNVAPIAAAHLPTSGPSGPEVALTGVAASSSLNAIPDGQRLTFATTGLTAVYGDNGAGKSGYARVLRHACHARGAADSVLPNVYGCQPGAPTAQVDYAVGAGARSFTWSQDCAGTPDELRTVAVFDSSAATTLLERDNEVLWTPGGIDLLVRLAAVIDDVRGRLQQAASAVAVRGPLPEVPTATSAYALLGRLSATTTSAERDAITLRPDEQEDLKRLDAALAAPDPAAAAAQVRQRGQRFAALRNRLVGLEALLGEKGLRQLAELRTTHQAAVDSERLLAETTLGESQVPGVGGEPWRALWQAAERYASSGATPDRAFPTAEAPGLCVLCQQPLGSEARQRLQGFHAFVRADVATRRTNAEQTLHRRLHEIGQLRAREANDGALLEELTAIDAANGPGLAKFLDAAGDAVMAIGAPVPGAAGWHLPAALPAGWPAWLQSLIDNGEKQAIAMQSAAAPDERRATHVRRQELLARQALAAGRALVDAEVGRLARRAALERAVASCVTTGITRKAGELTRTYVSERLMEAFDSEARALSLPVAVKYCHARNEKGTSFQRVVLNEAAWVQRTGGPVRVLSEGERRAVALAAFLAELGTREDRSGVVLDDPVSSLDHERRRIVAARLARLASERQVVVFTHDLVFLHMLRSAAHEAGAPVTDREVRKNGAVCGVCRDKAPVKAMSIKALVGELKERHQGCAATHGAGDVESYEGQLANTFGLLREAWERAVEELLLNGTVMRFDHRVQTQRLKHVHDITPEDLAQVDAGMTVCSKWLPGHALAQAMNEPLPAPEELLAEIQRLEGFVQAMRKRGRS